MMDIYNNNGTHTYIVEADDFNRLMLDNIDSVFESYLLTKFKIGSDELKEIIKKHYPEKFI